MNKYLVAIPGFDAFQIFGAYDTEEEAKAQADAANSRYFQKTPYGVFEFEEIDFVNRLPVYCSVYAQIRYKQSRPSDNLVVTLSLGYEVEYADECPDNDPQEWPEAYFCPYDEKEKVIVQAIREFIDRAKRKCFAYNVTRGRIFDDPNDAIKQALESALHHFEQGELKIFDNAW